MNPSYPNQEQQDNPRTHGQSVGTAQSRSAPIGYGFEGVVALDQQQQQAYLANLKAPFMYQQLQQQRPFEPQPQQSQHYYPLQQHDNSQYQPPQPHHHWQAHQHMQTVRYPHFYPNQSQPEPQYTHIQQQPSPMSSVQQYHTQPSQMQSDVGRAQSHVSYPQDLQSPPPPHQASHWKANVPQQAHLSINPQSIDGTAGYVSKSVHAQQPKRQQKQQPQQAPAKPETQPLPEAKSSTLQSPRPDPPAEDRLLLLSLADQYISQARLSAHQVISQVDEQQRQQYYKLIATGLACYETVLKTPSWKSPPRQEAMIRLRFAMVLHEETENDRVVEETLAKGIALCERNRLTDLKYSMQHLLARAIFETKPKAAFKAIDRAIEEAKASRHVAWMYAFHLLRASLIMHKSPPDDLKNALMSLQAVSELARSQRDSAVCAAASVSEALLHLRLKQPDWHEEFERSLALARAQLMSSGDKAIPQIGAQIYILDVASVLELGQPKMAEQKRKAMLSFFDSIITADWSSDGTFMVPIKGSTADTHTADTCGIFAYGEGSKTQLRLSWLDKMGSWALAYMFNGMVNLSKPNQHEQPDAESLLKEALKYSEAPLSGDGTARSLEAASLQVQARARLTCFILLNLTVLHCNRHNLEDAAATLQALKKLKSTSGASHSENISDLVLYLDATILHANGQIADALRAYQSPQLALQPDDSGIKTIRQQLSILASLSIILIVRAPTHPSHHLLRPLLDLMAPIFANVKSTSDAHEKGLNPQLAAAYNLVLAVAHEDRWTGGSIHDDETSVLSTKKHLQTCFHVAKDMYNHLLLTVGLSFLHTQLFHGQVGDQALKSAQSAQEMAKNAGSPLWSCVSDGIAARAYEKSGLVAEAQKARDHGEKMAQALPNGVVEMLENNAHG